MHIASGRQMKDALRERVHWKGLGIDGKVICNAKTDLAVSCVALTVRKNHPQDGVPNFNAGWRVCFQCRLTASVV
jgi:hypothetical protein